MKLITSSLTTAGLITALLLTQIGCSESAQEPLAESPVLSSEVPDGMVRGTVAETMNTGGYTYVLIDTGQDLRWTAAPETVVKVGDIVQTSQGMAMTDFTSNSLNRTFDVVYFVGALQDPSAPALPEGHPSTEKVTAIESPTAQVAELKPGENIAYVHTNKDALAGQQISLRGEVVKYNANILGTNFIHIQDSSGDAASGSNDLTVTSKSATAVGEMVVVTGTIVLNKDFGSGYTFPVLMEDASITVE